ncbi:hypothetical protein PVE_R2G0283 [Pseudomonas veronii 1YdBTEX2]|uniref:Uncharacterized protein n=1 Tax=Pseudomonas veronii 1YdBTEX2 TaxID=1295141 RepID=A0A1D3K7R9_PSEVE|nr:hypothetical protein PVE_R2G0283 [Pseudomonas veronii 1YdBTEX2]
MGGTFSSQVHFPDLPTIEHMVVSGAEPGDSFVVDRGSVLVRHPVGDEFAYTSNDASGVFLVCCEIDGAVVDTFVKFHNGLVTSCDNNHSQACGYRFDPTWIRSHRINRSDLICSPEATKLVSLIRAVDAGEVVDLESDMDRVMVALALCHADLLGAFTPAQAWTFLDDAHFCAVTQWAR